MYYSDSTTLMQYCIIPRTVTPGLTDYHSNLKVHFSFLFTSRDLSLGFYPISHSAYESLLQRPFYCPPVCHVLLLPQQQMQYLKISLYICLLVFLFLLTVYPSFLFYFPPSALFSFVLTDCWSLEVMVLVLSGSQMTMSASEPTAIRPLRGYRLKIFAALVDVTATNWFSSIFPKA